MMKGLNINFASKKVRKNNIQFFYKLDKILIDNELRLEMEKFFEEYYTKYEQERVEKYEI